MQCNGVFSALEGDIITALEVFSALGILSEHWADIIICVGALAGDQCVRRIS